MTVLLWLIIEGKKQAMQIVIATFFKINCLFFEHSSVEFRTEFVQYYTLYRCRYCHQTTGPIIVRKEFKKELEEKQIFLQPPYFYDD